MNQFSTCNLNTSFYFHILRSESPSSVGMNYRRLASKSLTPQLVRLAQRGKQTWPGSEK
jgi:hypothetical protein